MRRLAPAVVLAASLAACGGPSVSAPPTPPEPTPGAETPEAAVSGLIEALAAGDTLGASLLTVDGQMVLVALAEGVTVEEAILLMERGADEVGQNFWAGFGEGLGEFLGSPPEELRIGGVERFAVEGVRFARVEVGMPLDSTVRRFVVREGDGWKVDAIATFASALASKLAHAADLVREDPEAASLLELMRHQDVSLQSVLTDPSTGPELQQAVVSAIEAIRR